ELADALLQALRRPLELLELRFLTLPRDLLLLQPLELFPLTLQREDGCQGGLELIQLPAGIPGRGQLAVETLELLARGLDLLVGDPAVAIERERPVTPGLPFLPLGLFFAEPLFGVRPRVFGTLHRAAGFFQPGLGLLTGLLE